MANAGGKKKLLASEAVYNSSEAITLTSHSVFKRGKPNYTE